MLFLQEYNSEYHPVWRQYGQNKDTSSLYPSMESMVFPARYKAAPTGPEKHEIKQRRYNSVSCILGNSLYCPSYDISFRQVICISANNPAESCPYLNQITVSQKMVNLHSIACKGSGRNSDIENQRTQRKIEKNSAFVSQEHEK